MDYNVIATFEHDNKTYLFYTYDDIRERDINLLYGYYDSNKNIKPVDEKDISLMNRVSNDIFISKDKSNHVKLNSIIYNGKIFQIMYDKVSGLKFFYELKDGVYSIPSDNDLVYLSNMYNKVTYNLKLFEVVDDEKIKNEPFLKKYSWIGGSLFLSTVAIVTVLAMPEIHNKYQVITSKIEYVSGQYISNDFSIERVIAAINANPNLTDEEKEFFLNKNDMLIQNAKYIDMNALENKLKVFSIDYVKEENPRLLGLWDRAASKMTIYGSTSFSDARKETLSHEYNHVCSNVYSSFGNGLNEAISETITNENYNHTMEERKSYHRICAYLKILCEIIGPEPLMAYYYSGNIYNVVDALKGVIPDEDMAISLIGELDNVLVNENEYGIVYTLNGSNKESLYNNVRMDEIEGNIDVSDKKIYDLLSKYFYAKNEYLMEYDAIVTAYLHCFNNNLSIPDIYIENRTGYIGAEGELGFYNYVDVTSIDKNYFKREDENARIDASILRFIDVFEEEVPSGAAHYDVCKYDVDGKEVSFVSFKNSYVLDSKTRVLKKSSQGQVYISGFENADVKTKG